MIIAVPLGLLLYTMYQEGTFDTTKNSLLILVSGINGFRRLKKEDLADVEEMTARNEELVHRIMEESPDKEMDLNKENNLTKENKDFSKK